jgi:Ap4A phosphorylase N-terminal domain
MKDHIFDSEQQFKQAFNQGLVQLLSSHQSAGTFILALANFIQHPELYKVNQSLILDVYSQLSSYYQQALDSALEVEGAKDDIKVMRSIIRIGLENIKKSDVRHIEDGSWAIYFNHLRSFRPERMSNQKVKSIDVEFDSDSFNFNKPFLEKEIFVEQVVNERKISLLYNKFPFADYHGLLVLERDKEHKQYLSKDIFHYIWAMYSNIKLSIKNQVIAYNSLGAGASVNHLHFQTCIMDKPLSIASKKWLHNGGTTKYPAECLVLNSKEEAWQCIDNLQCNNIPFNFILLDDNFYCLPRCLDFVKSEAIPQVGWFEMAGAYSLANNDIFQSLEKDKIREVLSSMSRE